MKPSNVVASPISGVYKAPLTVELDCPSVKVEPTSVDTGLDPSYHDYYTSRNISKVGNDLFFNAQPNTSSSGLLGIYDINTNTITRVPCPFPTYGASFIYINNTVYIIGGVYPVDVVRHNKIMKYNEGIVDEIEEILPVTASFMSCNAVGNYIYIIGGSTSDNRLSTIYRLDTTNDTIEEMNYSLDTACSSTSSAVYQNRHIYVIGGFSLKRKTIQIIDTLEGTVSLFHKDLPVSIDDSGAMIKDDFLYVFGDGDEVYKKYLLDDSDWVLDTQTLAYERWSSGYTSDEKGYYHTIGGSSSEASYYETGRFGLPISDIEIRYTQTEDGTIPADPTQEDTLYNEPIKLTSPTKHNIKAKAFYVGE